jgi:ABC-2 type transport system ATP-binding protein
MLQVKNLKHRFGAHEVLKSISFEIAPGQVAGIVGLNGAGKTTLMNLLCHYLPIESGEILWQNLPIRRQEVAFLETQNYFYPNITAAEYLSIFPEPPQFLEMDLWKKRFLIPENEMIEYFSTGMKKRLALLGLMHLDRPVIVLDEPYNGLDLEAIYWFEQLLLTWQTAGKAILMTSHVLGTLTQTCQQIHWLKQGQLVKTFQPEDFTDISTRLFEDLSV